MIQAVQRVRGPREESKIKILRGYSVYFDVFDRILSIFKDSVKIVDDDTFKGYMTGYKDKSIIIVKKDMTQLICREYIVYSIQDEYYEDEILQAKIDGNIEAENEIKQLRKDILNEYNSETRHYWMQCVVTKSNTSQIKKEMYGFQAYKIMMSKLKKYYTDEEIDECLMSHQEVENQKDKQQHYNIMEDIEDSNKIYKFNNCYEYDINSAHGSALCEIFPKAKDELTKMYNERKIKPQNKEVFNKFVGELGSKHKNNGKYRNTYWWIVHRTTRLLLAKIKKVGGNLLYANTDGFIVQNPDNPEENNKAFGEFKLEYKGPVWFDRGENFVIFEKENNEIKGSAPLNIRSKIDLAKGKTVSYKIKFVDVKIEDEVQKVQKIYDLKIIRKGVMENEQI